MYDIRNADVADVYNNLQDLFQRNNVRPQNSTVNPSLGKNSPLYQREKSNTQPTTQGSTTGIGGSGAMRRRRRWAAFVAMTTQQPQPGSA